MGCLQNKRFLITGLISNRSIAYGLAAAMHREGASLAFTYQSHRIKERVRGLIKDFDSDMLYPCDVAEDAQIESLFTELNKKWDKFDGFVHAIAFSPKEALSGDFLDASNREAFMIAHDISAYSFIGMAKAASPMMEGRNAALLSLSYLGAERTIPNYNIMGVAKASLESAVRYTARSLGPKGIRVNAISAGPVKTLAAAGIGSFQKIFKFVEEYAPLRRNVTIEDIGNTAAFLMSDLAAGITGEITYVDGGFNIIVGGMEAPDSSQ